MLRLAPYLPDALVGVPRVMDGVLDETRETFPHRPDDLLGAPVQVRVHGVYQHAPHGVLVLVPGTVADAYRLGVAPARQVVERSLGEVSLAADPVHDLELGEGLLGVLALKGPEYEGEVLERLPVVAEPVEGAQGEPGVSDPGVAVVPVACPAGGFRQSGRRSCHDGAGRRVTQPLERQRAALKVGAPRVVGESPGAEPLPPEADGGLQVGVRLLFGSRRGP